METKRRNPAKGGVSGLCSNQSIQTVPPPRAGSENGTQAGSIRRPREEIVLMSAKKYFGAFCLYLNYLVHGIGVLVMSLNVHEFEVQWQTVRQAYPS